MNNMHKQIVKVFLKLGFFAYGGPAAHIAMMNDEIVVKRKWLSEADFLDLISFTNLIPGPNSTETAIVIGYKKGGIKGLFLAGFSFIIPAVIVVMLFTQFYVSYGELPQVQGVISGMIPVMLAIICVAIIKLTKGSVTKISDFIILLISVILLMLNLSEIVVIGIGAILSLISIDKLKSKLFSVEPFSMFVLFTSFFKIGAVLYGSGYVLISFLQSQFVHNLKWLTQNELLQLSVIGEITPGPVFTTATAIGYYLNGISGSLLATIAIFNPSFTFILILFPLYERLKEVEIISKLLRGVSLASLAIMINVALTISLSVLSNTVTTLLSIFAFIFIYKFKINNFILIILGALVGLIFL